MSPERWRHVRVLWNEGAGEKTGPARTALTREALLALMARHGLGDDIRPTTTPEATRQLARAAVEDGCDLVIAAGGDGTIGAAARELLETDVPLGILPLGTIMNIPRMLGLPRELEPAAAILAGGRTRLVDVGMTDGVPFFEAGTVGMNAAMFREAQRFDRGDWSSIVRTLWVALRYRPARMAIQLDGEVVVTRALVVTVANGPYTGAAMTVAPRARLDDGRFDVIVFRRFSKLQLLRHLAGIAFGRYRPAPEIETYRSAAVRITSHHPLPARADSRDLGMTPVEFHVRPSALRVVVPEAAAAGTAAAGPRTT